MATKKQEFSAQEALDRVLNSNSVSNFEAIYNGFSEMGISPTQIDPRINVFTYRAWLAKGRVVKKGQHGVKIRTFVSVGPKKDGGEEKKGFRMPKTTTVFHESQTELLPEETKENE